MRFHKRVSVGSWLLLLVIAAAATASAVAVAQFRGQADTYRQTQLLLSQLQGTSYQLDNLRARINPCDLSATRQGEWETTLHRLRQQTESLFGRGDTKLQHLGLVLSDYLANASQCEASSSTVARSYSYATSELSKAINEYDGAAQQSIWKSNVEACLGLLAFVVSLAMILWRLGLARHGAELAEAEARVLQVSERRLRTLTEKSSDLLLIVDENGKFKDVGSAVQNLLGYNPGPSAPSLFDVIHPDDSAATSEVLKAVAAQEGYSRQFELRFRHADSSLRIFEVSVSNCLSVDGIDGLVLNGHDITERKRTEEKLAYDAFHDGLTGLPNRSLFSDRLQRAINRARRSPEYKYAVLFIDVDRFKLINDSLGHNAGDCLLLEVATRLRNCIRQTTPERPPAGDDSVARFGGDEFTILLEEFRQPVDATRIAERILDKFQLPFTVGDDEVFVSVSLGIAIGTMEYYSADQVLRDADIAMYRSKAAGGSGLQVFNAGMHLAAQKRLQLENDLRRALKQDQFEVLLQPIVQIARGRVESVEALVRWRHPEYGLLAPAEFISVAEDTGLIVAIGRTVMREACQQLRRLQQACPGNAPSTVSVNLSAKEFGEPDLLENIRRALQDAGLPASALRIEITETVAMTNVDKVQATLQQLKELGVGISIDDFGTGYSSLSYLKRFPVDTLKIDRSFVTAIDQDPENRKIVQTILDLASSLGMEAVAEGTETSAQIAVLRGMGCKFAQGYYYSKPVTWEAVEAGLHSHPASELTRNDAVSAVPTNSHGSRSCRLVTAAKSVSAFGKSNDQPIP